MKPITTSDNIHICPKCNGYIAHVQEPLSNSGTPNVFINGKRTILKNNMCVCIDSHDINAQGEPPSHINSATSNTKVTIPPKRILFPKMPIIGRIGAFLKVKRPI